MNSRLALLRDCRASAGTELVLSLPFVILLLLGATELAHYFYIEHQVVKGVRDGARYGSRQSFVEANCTGGSPSTLPSSVETAIKNVTRTGRVGGESEGGKARVTGWDNGDITVAVTCPSTSVTTGIYKNADNAPQINVSTTLVYPALFGDIGFIDFSGFDLNASQQSAVMGI